MVTESQLARIMPRLGRSKRDRYLPLLNAAMREFGITTPAREAAFLAQLAHESAALRFMRKSPPGRPTRAARTSATRAAATARGSRDAAPSSSRAAPTTPATAPASG
jgi:hypothetical protein